MIEREFLLSRLAVSTLPWRFCRRRGCNGEGADNFVDCAPVARLVTVAGAPELRLGISSQGEWLVLSPDDTVEDFGRTGNFWPLLPLLEMSYLEARGALADEFTKHNLDTGWIEYFPFDRLVAAGLQSESMFWPDNALLWLPFVQPSSIYVRSALEFLRERGKTQRQRHAAQKALASLKWNGGYGWGA